MDLLTLIVYYLGDYEVFPLRTDWVFVDLFGLAALLSDDHSQIILAQEIQEDVDVGVGHCFHKDLHELLIRLGAPSLLRILLNELRRKRCLPGCLVGLVLHVDYQAF